MNCNQIVSINVFKKQLIQLIIIFNSGIETTSNHSI